MVSHCKQKVKRIFKMKFNQLIQKMEIRLKNKFIIKVEKKLISRSNIVQDYQLNQVLLNILQMELVVALIAEVIITAISKSDQPYRIIR